MADKQEKVEGFYIEKQADVDAVVELLRKGWQFAVAREKYVVLLEPSKIAVPKVK